MMDVEPADEPRMDAVLTGQRLVLILRGYGVDRSLELARAAWDLGLARVEVPLQTSVDADALEAVAAAGRERGHPVGAGTVVRVEQVRTAQRLGAAFTVSPGLDADVVRACRDVGLPTLPGVSTPTEIQAAGRLGLRWLKAFPATALGPDWFRAVRGPFPDVRLVATGGIDAGNAAGYLAAGAALVAVGSAASDPGAVAALGPVLRGEPAS